MSASERAINGLVLGLDIGAASVGWALVDFQDGDPISLKAMGARVFPAGVNEGSVDSVQAGLEKSSASARREARSRRRQIARTRRRLTKLARLLQRHGLLPPGELDSPEQIHRYFLKLDSQLFSVDLADRDQQVRYYHLRARALDEQLTHTELGRALYHLAHRRGFKSNAKPTTRQSDDGPVKKEIGELDRRMCEKHARTLGEYLSLLNPEEARLRGPEQYVGRDEQVRPEFEAIWQAQAAHFPDLLTEELKKEVTEAIFFQRPFRIPTRHLGFCDLEKDQRRAPMALLAAQRFRVLDKVNLLSLISGEQSRDLTPSEQAKLTERLETKEELTFDEMRKLLDLSEGRFNLETLGTTKLIGNHTASRLARLLGKRRWAEMSADQQDNLVDDLLTRTPPAVERRALRRGLDEETARKLSEVKLDPGHSRLSRKALERVLPLMEEGKPFATARECCYPRGAGDALPLLPPLDQVADVRNPIVTRSLSEVRKVVNAIVREYGLPARVRIELARDLKRNREQRRYLHGRMLDNERSREETRRSLEGMGIEPSGWNIERYLLWEECNRHCPYCGQPISKEALFNNPPQAQVEHIIPRPRAMGFGNSFLNKTLGHVACNQRKGNRTPWEAFGDSPRWEDILRSVSSFRGEGRGREVTKPKRGKKAPPVRTKLDLFQLRQLVTLDDFTRQQLTDTQYAARLAIEYLGQLYGAGPEGNDATGVKRVQAGRGQVTSTLRAGWGLNETEIEGGEKKRDDHRQHAIDALCVALTDAKTIQELSRSAERGFLRPGQRLDRMTPPWPTLLAEAKCKVSDMVVSHRVSRRVAGGMHRDTHYGRYEYEGRTWAHVRIPVAKLTPADIKNETIVDPRVRECVKCALNGRPPKEAFKDEQNHPRLGKNPIHKVRVRRKDPLRTVGGEFRERHVELDSNHHMVIYAKGATEWKGDVVSRYDAMRRLSHKRRSQQVVVLRNRDGFQFSLSFGEVIELADKGDARGTASNLPPVRRLYVVRSVWESEGIQRVAFKGVNDARKQTGEEGKRNAGVILSATSDMLLKRACRKVLLTPLGEVRSARD